MATKIGSENPYLARAVREMRLRRGMTMESLAYQSGLTTNTVWRIENGLARRPTTSTLDKLAATLKIDVDDLKGLAD